MRMLIYPYFLKLLDLHISHQLTDPINIYVAQHSKQSTGTVSMTADKDGRYTYCFSNEMSTVSDKKVRYERGFPRGSSNPDLSNSRFPSFNVHGVVYVPDDGTLFHRHSF